MSTKIKWSYENVIGKRHVYARATRTEIVVMAQSVRFWNCAKGLRELLGDLKP